MCGFGRRREWIAAIPLTLLFTFACSRRGPDVPSEAASENPSSLQAQASDARDNPAQRLTTIRASDTEPPFQSSETIPNGTLLIVSLKTSVVVDKETNQPFKGILEQPIVVDGNTLIPRDTPVSGLIESAHISKASPDRDYVRLALSSVDFDGLSLPIQTATLFARQRPSVGTISRGIRLEKGRRLTFRLNEPVFLHSNVTKSSQ